MMTEKLRKKRRRIRKKIKKRKMRRLKKIKERNKLRKSLLWISINVYILRNKLEEVLKKKAEAKGGKKKNNKLSGVDAAKKAVEER
jgi:hypothetical protein